MITRAIVTTKHNSAHSKMRHLIKKGIPFRYSLSSRTIVIEYNNIREKYIQSRMNPDAFIAYQMIQQDLKKSKVKLPAVNAWQVRYYQHNIRESIKVKHGYFIDIKSAYANILFNDGYISERCFNFIMDLPKPDRLACLGMLAARKEWYSVDEHGSVQDEGEEVNDLSSLFFYAVKRTFEIMDNCKVMIGINNQILNWVDCIYFREMTDGVRDAMLYLESENLSFHFHEIKNFSCIIFKNNIRIGFRDRGKRKVFRLPIAKGFSNGIRIAMNSTRSKSKSRI